MGLERSDHQHGCQSAIRRGRIPRPAGPNRSIAWNLPAGQYNANLSESWLAVKPGTEDLVGTSKIFFEKYSTFYMFHLGAIDHGARWRRTRSRATTASRPAPRRCRRRGRTTPIPMSRLTPRAVRTRSRCRSTPSGPSCTPTAIDLSYTDDLGQHWVKGNGGQDLEQSPNCLGEAAGSRRGQAVGRRQRDPGQPIPGSRVRDVVGVQQQTPPRSESPSRVTEARRSRKARTITAPSQTGPSNTYIYPSVDAAGDLYVAFASFPINPNRGPVTHLRRAGRPMTA